jgi:hypothetical protein
LASSGRGLAAAALTAAALLGAGCGGDDAGSTGAATTTPIETATAIPPATVPPPATATATAPEPAPTATPPPAATTTAPSPENEPGGAGDEQPIRVPAAFTFADGGVTPAQVAVPAFLNIELVGLSRDGRPHTLSFRGVEVRVPAGGRGAATVEGLRKGRYPVAIDGRAGAATIVSGAEPGP